MYGPPKEVVYDSILWAEATLQFEDLKEVFQGDKQLTRHVHGDMYFVSSIWERNNVRYSGIHELDDSASIIRNTGVNLDNYEWTNIMRKTDTISAALFGSQTVKGEKRNSPKNEVQMWTYKWSVNEVDVVDDHPLHFFSEQDARKNAEAKKPLGKKSDKIQLHVSSEFKVRPRETLQMKMVVIEVVRNLIHEYKLQSCEGCQNDPVSPGQKSHMGDGGCLDPTVSTNDIAAEVWKVLKPEDLMVVYNAVCRHLCVSPHGSGLLAAAAIEWSCTDRISDIIDGIYPPQKSADETSLDVNQPLLNIVRGASKIMCVKVELSKRF